MKNLLLSISEKKQNLIAQFAAKKTEGRDTQFNFHEFLISEGNILYLPANFNFQGIVSKVQKFMAKTLHQKTKTQKLENTIIKIQYHPAKGILKTIGLGGKFVLLLLPYEKQLIFAIESTDWFENPTQKQPIVDISSWVKDAYEKEITDFLSQEIIDEFIELNNRKPIDTKNRFIEQISAPVQTWFYCQQEDNEILLCNLNISELKKVKDGEIPTQKLELHYIITTENISLVGFDQRGELDLFYDLTNLPISVKKEIGRDPILAEGFEWLSTRSNDTLFQEIVPVIPLGREDKIRKIATLNYLNKNKETSQRLLKQLFTETNDDFDELSLFFVSNTGTQINFEENTDAEKLITILKKVIENKNTTTKLPLWSENWKISRTNKAALIKLFTEVATSTEQEKRILPFHRTVFNEFVETEKDELNKILAQINFCRNLINSGQKEEASKILSKALENIPDETVSDLLLDNNANPTSEINGQMVRISILDLLIEASKDNDIQKHVHQLAMLQPLSKKRLQQLAQCKLNDKSEKAAELLKLLETVGLNVSENHAITEPSVIPEKMFETFLRHPASRQSGAFFAMQKWLAKIDAPDHSAVKSFSDTLTHNDFSEAFDALREVKKMFGKYDTEVFVARGEKSTGIIGFEGNPSFILIGKKHLDNQSEYFLSIPELKFVFSCEMAHLYFKHSKITSNDVWRGAMDKGFIFADSLLSFIPAVGILGKSIQNIGKLTAISKVLKSAEKLSSAKDILDASSKMSSIYNTINKKDAKKDAKKELLAISRLMQLSADRAGLLFSGNIIAAIRMLFFNSDNFLKFFNEANDHGLENFILQKNNDGSYRHQNLAVRLANLFSFYLSFDYGELVKAMNTNKKAPEIDKNTEQ